MLRVEHISKSFDGVRALNDVTLAAEPGRITGIIGPNGSGKSTLFNVITGVFVPDRGRITLNGAALPSGNPEAVARVGLTRTYQIPRIASHMTVLENLLAVPRDPRADSLVSLVAHRAYLKERERRLLVRGWEVLAEVELTHMANDWAGSLSGGQRKLLSLGMAIMAEPEVYLLDEPAAGVNPVLIARSLRILKAIRDSGKSVLIIEHNMQLISDVCDEVYVLDAGELIAQGTPDLIRQDLRVRQAYLGTRG